MAGMARKEIVRLANFIEPQGVNITRTKDGLLLRLPDGETAMLHFSSSDVNSVRAIRAKLRRSGITWPGDEERGEIGKNITESPRPNAAIMNRVMGVLGDWEQKYITAAQLSRMLTDDPPVSATTAQRALFHLGWLPSGPVKRRKWSAPFKDADLFTDDPKLQFHEGEALEEKARAEAAAAAEAEAAKAPGEREFLDSHDSWTASLDELSGDMTIAQLLNSYRAVGLQFEVRVWRM